MENFKTIILGGVSIIVDIISIAILPFVVGLLIGSVILACIYYL